MQLKNRLRRLNTELKRNFNQRSRFLKNVLIFEKKGGGAYFFGVCMVGCMGRISHTNLKNRTCTKAVFSGTKSPPIMDQGKVRISALS